MIFMAYTAVGPFGICLAGAKTLQLKNKSPAEQNYDSKYMIEKIKAFFAFIYFEPYALSGFYSVSTELTHEKCFPEIFESFHTRLSSDILEQIQCDICSPISNGHGICF